ncbi:MAG: IS200/IS605 family transposase [Verrucomicrobiales bacterium]|nr:IS200/IS605 family transposase [Verrucomicrobiales bacterium]
MASTYLSLHFHVVFGTKDRRPLIRPEWRGQLHEYLGGTIRGLEGFSEGIGGVEDHVHLLVGLKATHRLADFMREFKKASSMWATEKYEPEFAWQDGYAAFTVSASQLETVRRYIANQEEHHRKLGFREELMRLLEKSGVRFETQYLP